MGEGKRLQGVTKTGGGKGWACVRACVRALEITAVSRLALPPPLAGQGGDGAMHGARAAVGEVQHLRVGVTDEENMRVGVTGEGQ